MNITRTQRSLILAVVHVALALSVAGKFLYDRQTLPRVWARTMPYDPNLPLRGRYVRLFIAVDYTGAADHTYAANLSLAIADGKLQARQDPPGEHMITRLNDTWRLSDALAYFIPEGVSDPSVRKPGEELWVEVSLPENGPPRPIRLGVRTVDSKGVGEIVPLDLD